MPSRRTAPGRGEPARWSFARTSLRWLLVAGLGWLLASSAWAQEPAFVNTPAGQAFRSRQYEAALVELQRMIAADPRDVLALRYLGITLDRLGRYPEAVDAFDRALALEPKSAATHFHLGVTYYKLRASERARESFLDASRLGPDTVYDQMADRYLDALTRQEAEQQRPGAPRFLSVFADVGVQYDANVPAAPDDRALYDDRRAGLRLAQYVSAELRPLRRPGWLGLLEGATYQAQYLDGDFDDFGLSTYGIGALLQRDTTLAELPLVLSTRYDHNWVFLAGDRYSRSHVATGNVRLDLGCWTATNVSYRYTRDDFEDEGFDPDFSSRDADNHAVELAQILYFAERSGQVRAGYEFQTNRARGLNFDFDSHRVALAVGAPLPGRLDGDLVAEYAHTRHPKFQGPVRREADRWEIRGGLSRWFAGRFRVRLTGAWTIEQSNYEVLEYDRWVVAASASYVY